jgi:putative transposase
MAVADLCRQHGFSPASFYQWRAKYGGMEAEDAKRLKELESENNQFRRLLAEAHLDIEALKVGFGVKRQPRNASARPSGACASVSAGLAALERVMNFEGCWLRYTDADPQTVPDQCIG